MPEVMQEESLLGIQEINDRAREQQSSYRIVPTLKSWHVLSWKHMDHNLLMKLQAEMFVECDEPDFEFVMEWWKRLHLRSEDWAEDQDDIKFYEIVERYFPVGSPRAKLLEVHTDALMDLVDMENNGGPTPKITH